jgi:hypothetical protein
MYAVYTMYTVYTVYTVYTGLHGISPNTTWNPAAIGLPGRH